jgi:hypothetical protein
MQNPDLLSFNGDFIRSFREQMRGFHGLLFILLRWSAISFASLKMRSIYRGLPERMAV